MKTVNVKDSSVIQRLVRNLSRKHRAFVYVVDQVKLTGAYWDGGNRSEYYLVDTATGASAPIHGSHTLAPQFGGAEAAPIYEIPEGKAVVRVGTFMGKPATPTVYFRPDPAILDALAGIL